MSSFQPSNQTLVVFDFDWTLIDADSDEVCLRYFGGDEAIQSLTQSYKNGGVWCELVAQELTRLFEKRDIYDISALTQALQLAPMHPSTANLLIRLHEAGCLIVILSDANTFFIETILDLNQVRHCVHKIISNQSSFHRTNSGRDVLVVQPLQGPNNPHDCKSCPSNLCKASMLAKWLQVAQTTYSITFTVFYCGDGLNDFCPLASGLVHTAFVRVGKKLHGKLMESPEKVTCPVIHWDCGNDLQEKMLRTLIIIKQC